MYDIVVHDNDIGHHNNIIIDRENHVMHFVRARHDTVPYYLACHCAIMHNGMAFSPQQKSFIILMRILVSTPRGTNVICTM